MRRLTTEEFIAKSKLVHGEKYDYSGSNYIDIKTKVLIECNAHGKFSQSPEHHLSGKGCSECGKITQKKTCLEKYGAENPFISDICKKKSRETMLRKYGTTSAIQSPAIKQKIEGTNLRRHGFINPFQNPCIIERLKHRPDRKSIIEKANATIHKKYGVSCALLIPRAKQKMLERRREYIIDNLFRGNRLNNKVVPVFEESDYVSVTTKYQWKCKCCENLFYDHLDDGRVPRCPTCYPYVIDSQYEYEIIDFIKTFYNGEIIHGNRTLLSGKEVDIYLPEDKIAIEFDGLYYHSEITGGKSRSYHLNKTSECDKLGIRLIHIFEDEWRKKSEIVKSKLKSILGNTPHKIYARKCQVKEISSSICNKFLANNHLQGSDNSSIRIGLYNEDTLMSVMTFGSLRKALGSYSVKHHYEMYRFCSLIDHTVTGGASKLFSYFVKTYSPGYVMSFADRRWSVGGLYKSLNFTEKSKTRPNYFYTMDHYKRFHRFNFRKSLLPKKLSIFDPNLSEWNNMKINGWDRIWDCGHLKYEWILSNID